MDWKDIDRAPISDPARDVRYFLAYCPDTGWDGPLGKVQVACRYEHTAPGHVHVLGASHDQRATHYCIPTPPTPNQMPDREYIVCTYCTGTGMRPGSIVHACMRCNGSGKIEVIT